MLNRNIIFRQGIRKKTATQWRFCLAVVIDNGGTIFIPTNNISNPAKGVWMRCIEGTSINARWFGMIGTSILHSLSKGTPFVSGTVVANVTLAMWKVYSFLFRKWSQGLVWVPTKLNNLMFATKKNWV